MPCLSTRPTGGVVNIPFVVRQANATVVKSTFWIQELKEKDKNGEPKLRLQYSQLVMLDFFPRSDGLPPGCCPGLIQWRIESAADAWFVATSCC